MAMTTQNPFGSPVNQQGMFGTMKNGSQYTPQGFGPQSYDLTGMQKANQMFNANPGYQAQTYKPYQFTNPSLSAMHPYGMTDPSHFQNIYNQAFQAGASPIRSQGREAMRQTSQGFEGGHLGGAANAALAMNQAQNTGSQLQDLGNNLGSQMAQARLGEEQTARQQDYSDQQNVRNMQYQQEQERQKMQSGEDFQAAGFGNQNSQYMAQDALNRANTMFGWGNQYNQFQGQAQNQSQNAYMQQIMAQMAGLGGGA